MNVEFWAVAETKCIKNTEGARDPSAEEKGTTIRREKIPRWKSVQRAQQ